MNNEDLNEVFKSLKIKAISIAEREEGPFKIYDIKLQSGGKFKQLDNNATEIALLMKSKKEPFFYTISEKGIIKMELMMGEPQTVHFNEMDFDSSGEVSVAVGKTRFGKTLGLDIIKLPHLLISGSTGSGKSVFLHSLIAQFIQQNVQMALIDPKRVEFNIYENAPNLFTPIGTNIEEAQSILNQLMEEMEERFKILADNQCRNIQEYEGSMPYIILVIDELAELMMVSNKLIQLKIARLAQKSRACGIHLIVATQRPSTDVITGIIKANFPARIAFKASSSIDSRTIIGKNGAERLMGKGDAVFLNKEGELTRFQGAYLTTDDIDYIVRLQRSKFWWRNIWQI